MQELAIVILNFNGFEHLTTFLPSVCQYNDNFPIVIIDNASTDDSILLLNEKFPQIEVIKLTSNYGFAAGYNEGLALMKNRFRFYILLNSDVEVTQNWIPPLLSVMQDETVAACQPKIRSYTKQTHFEHAGAAGGFLDKNYFPFCRGRIFDHCEEDHGQYDSLSQVTWTSGAAMLIRSELFHSFGGFDADFFAHMEEIDLCLRLNHAGYTMFCEPKSVVYHLGGGTMTYESPTKLFLNFRNNLVMLLKNKPNYWGPRLFIRMCFDGIAALQFLVKGQFTKFYMVIFAHFSFYAKIGQTLKKRRANKKNLKQFCIYKGNIIWDYYFKKNKLYNSLNKRRFT